MTAVGESSYSHHGSFICSALTAIRLVTKYTTSRGTPHMTDYDLIVLIPWAVVSIIFVLICVRLQISSRRSQDRPAQSAKRAQASREEPAEGQDAASRGRAATSTGQHY
jgi:hypothetical protein